MASLTPRITGHLDRIDATAIEGWVTMPNHPEQKIAFDVMLDGQSIGQCTADGFRQDLADASIGDGYCAFSFPMPAFVPAARLRYIRLRLIDSPVYLELPGLDETAQASPEPSTRATPSRFGGLWIDHADAIDQLGRRHRNGLISDDTCLKILQFMRDGYVVLHQAVSPAIINQLNVDIDAVWENPPPGLMIETFEPDGEMRYIPPDMQFRSGRTKLLDLYTVSQTARAAIAAPSVVSFLTAIFDAPPKAFQGLTFWNGSQQAIHKDTAYVKIDSNPLHLAATWLALEDIKPGTGELEYYVGSHRAPDFLFGGTSKWMESFVDDHPRFLDSLHQDAAKFGHVRKQFYGKAGDVLVWHADLAHGGAPIQNPGQSRRSLVTHLCPNPDEPFYRRHAHHAQSALDGVNFVSQYRDM